VYDQVVTVGSVESGIALPVKGAHSYQNQEHSIYGLWNTMGGQVFDSYIHPASSTSQPSIHPLSKERNRCQTAKLN